MFAYIGLIQNLKDLQACSKTPRSCTDQSPAQTFIHQLSIAYQLYSSHRPLHVSTPRAEVPARPARPARYTQTAETFTTLADHLLCFTGGYPRRVYFYQRTRIPCREATHEHASLSMSLESRRSRGAASAVDSSSDHPGAQTGARKVRRGPDLASVLCSVVTSSSIILSSHIPHTHIPLAAGGFPSPLVVEKGGISARAFS